MIELTDEQRLIQETARDFVDNEVIPKARDSDRAQKFDIDLARRLGEMGYLGAPVSGSVSPKQPNASPLVSGGSHRCFCSSEPQRSIDPQTSEVWTETTVRIAESPRPISSTIRP